MKVVEVIKDFSYFHFCDYCLIFEYSKDDLIAPTINIELLKSKGIYLFGELLTLAED